VRRRRRRGGGPQLGARAWAIIAGAAGVLFIGGFIALIGVADRAQPEQHEIRVELPDAIKD
jgi:hypothetical protein